MIKKYIIIILLFVGCDTYNDNNIELNITVLKFSNIICIPANNIIIKDDTIKITRVDRFAKESKHVKILYFISNDTLYIKEISDCINSKQYINKQLQYEIIGDIKKFNILNINNHINICL